MSSSFSRVAQRDLADLIVRPIVTEKAVILLEDNHYSFEVLPQATKPDIKAAIEYLFDVSVLKVNTYQPSRKRRRVGKFAGYRTMNKRAVVKLAEGDSIDLFPDS